MQCLPDYPIKQGLRLFIRQKLNVYASCFPCYPIKQGRIKSEKSEAKRNKIGILYLLEKVAA